MGYRPTITVNYKTAIKAKYSGCITMVCFCNSPTSISCPMSRKLSHKRTFPSC